MNLFGRFKRIILLARCLWRAARQGKADKIPANLSRIIVVLTGKLGDVVCCTPVLRAIRVFLPGTHIIVAGATGLHQPLLADSGLVDEYFDLTEPQAIKRLRRLDVGVALVTGPSYESTAILCATGIPLVVAPVVVGGFSPSVTKPYKILQRLVKTYDYHIGEYAPRERLRALEPLGIFTEDTKKQLGFSNIAQEKAKKFFVDNRIDPVRDFVVGISPSAGNKIKEWPTERFAQVADHLVEKYGAKVIITGEKGDINKAKEMIGFLSKKTTVIDSSGVFDLDGFKVLVSKFKLFISVDTGPIYIAEAFGVPTIDIVGPVDERVQPPRGFIHRNVLPPNRLRPELSILNARLYNQSEALHQVVSTSVAMVKEVVDNLIRDVYRPR